MAWTYIIQNSISNKRYIGSTFDTKRRLKQHNEGKNPSTRYGNETWRIVYFEEFPTIKEAQDRERVIKSYKGGNALKQLLACKRD